MRTSTWVHLGALLAGAAWAQEATWSPSAPAPAEAPPPVSLPPPATSAPPPPPPVTAAPPAAAVVPAPAVAPPTGRGPVEPREVVSDRSVGVHIGVNLGLFAFDVQLGRFYGFASGNAGIPLVTNGQVGAFAIGLGFTTPLSRPDESMWYMDLFAEALPGWFRPSGVTEPVVGVGAGLGFRYLHRSGFTAGFKVPVFGASFSGFSNFTTSQSVGLFYMFNGIALPIFSFGYRF